MCVDFRTDLRRTCVEIVELLLKAGVDVNIKDKVIALVLVLSAPLSVSSFTQFLTQFLFFAVNFKVFPCLCFCCSGWRDCFDDGCNRRYF